MAMAVYVVGGETQPLSLLEPWRDPDMLVIGIPIDGRMDARTKVFLKSTSRLLQNRIVLATSYHGLLATNSLYN